MSLFDQYQLNYFRINNEIPLDEDSQDSFIHEDEEQQSPSPLGQDLFPQELSNYVPEFYPIEDEEENQNLPSLQNLTQSLLDLHEPIDNEKPPVEMIQPILSQNIELRNNEVQKVLNTAHRETNNTSSVQVIPEIVKTSNRNNYLGRKRKEDKGKGNHTKYKKDNKMRKIKSYYIKFITEKINSSLSPEHKKLLRISPTVNENINRDYNITLMNNPLKKMFAENPINKRYSRKKIGKDYNKDLIEDIYNKKEETEAIKILDETYIHHLDVMRKQYLLKFKNDLIDKEIKNGETKKDAIKYVDELEVLLKDYEGWFIRKTPRRSRKGNKN